MKIFLLDYQNLLYRSDIEFSSNKEQFFNTFLDTHFDILVANFDFYAEVKEIKNYYSGEIIFLYDYVDELVYKKSLEVANYCYSYSELFKLQHRIEYIKKAIYKLNGSIFKHKNLLYNLNTSMLYKDSIAISLTKAQKEIIETLIKNRNNYLSAEMIIDLNSHIGTIGSIKVIISSLRKLGFDIISKQNQGYKIKE
jgi:DNA-binding response OmpR family regulator